MSHRHLAAALGALLAVASSGVSARAATSYVDDRAGVLNLGTRARVDAIDAALIAGHHKPIAVVTVADAHTTPLNGVQLPDSEHSALIYIAKSQKASNIVYPMPTLPITPAVAGSIAKNLSSSVRAEQYDAGVVNAVTAIADRIAGGASGGHGPAPAQVIAAQERWNGDGSNASWVWAIVGFIGILIVLRVAFARRGNPRPGSSPS
ncbi:MAG TPA: TPM domain-containing protein [Candidatus Binatus sp.]|nr:TPM domain-containing protein [Candidatus Binatus sp.]